MTSALLLSVLIASLIGSPHCVGMCGVFVAFATGAGDARSAGKLALTASYHGGRLMMYALLGAISGAMGHAVEFSGAAWGLPYAAAVVAGGMMTVFGLAALLRHLGVRIGSGEAWGYAPLKRGLLAAQRAAMVLPAVPRAGVIGLCTALLPCGWLWAFVAMSGGTASPLGGAAVMAVFWLGTLPALVTLGAGVRGLMGLRAPGLSVVTSVVIVMAGLYMIGSRLASASAEHAAGHGAAAHQPMHHQGAMHHHQAASPLSLPSDPHAGCVVEP